MSMADASPYVRQLKEASARVAGASGMNNWTLVYQSRSGPPSQPWLAPDICDYLREQHAAGIRCVIICPIGFILTTWKCSTIWILKRERCVTRLE